MTFEDEMNDMRLDSEETPPPEESGNRTFLIVAGILGAITVVTLVCIVAYAMIYLPRRQGQQATQVAQVNAQNTAMAQAITQTSVAGAYTATPTKSEEQQAAREYPVASGDTLASIAERFGVLLEDLMRINGISDPNITLQVGKVIYIPNPPTPTASPTPLLAVPTDTPVPTSDPRTATVAALLTQAAIAQQTSVPTSTALPSTGFAEDVGIPGLLGMAVLLVVVIFLARRLRSA
jgi:LPXTG-motif cell wall-anchored protein